MLPTPGKSTTCDGDGEQLGVFGWIAKRSASEITSTPKLLVCDYQSAGCDAFRKYQYYIFCRRGVFAGSDIAFAKKWKANLRRGVILRLAGSDARTKWSEWRLLAWSGYCSPLASKTAKAEQFASAVRQVSERSRRLGGCYAVRATGSTWPL